MRLNQAMNSFFALVYASVKKIINFDTAKVILLCSSGYLNEELLKYMDEESLKTDHVIHANLSKFLCVHSTSGHVHALKVISYCLAES